MIYQVQYCHNLSLATPCQPIKKKKNYKSYIENEFSDYFVWFPGENEPLSDPPSPRCTIDDEEDISLCVRSRKQVTTEPEVSSFLDLTFWKP